jgi:hypothetical protein
MCSAQFAADAGLERALVEIRDRFDSTLIDPSVTMRDWLCAGDATNDRGSPANTSTIGDNIGVGVPIERMYATSFTETVGSDHYYYANCAPSFPTTVAGRQVSGELQTGDILRTYRYVYTVKVVDTTSQINLNMNTSGLATMLNNLSKAIAKRGEYKGTDTNGPLHNLGSQIVLARPTGGSPNKGFTAKEQLVGVTNGTSTITMDDLKAVSDYIAVFPTMDELSNNTRYANNNPYLTSSSGVYRVPVNINTASWPVLVAVLSGLSGSGRSISAIGSVVPPNLSEAEKIADAICDYRRTEMFGDWDAIRDFFKTLIPLGTGIFNTAAEATDDVALIWCNADPNGADKSWNPDGPAYQHIESSTNCSHICKSNLTSSTTEFCFFPFGYFEIQSLGQVLDGAGTTIVASAQSSSVIKVLEVLKQTTQSQFEAGNRARYANDAAWVTDKRLKNSYTFPRAMRNTTGDAADGLIGYVAPVTYVQTTMEDHTDDVLYGNVHSPSPTFVFRQSFNGTSSTPMPDVKTAGSVKSWGTWSADGVAKSTFYHNCGNTFPPSSPTEPPNAANLPNDKGTLLFWFKLNGGNINYNPNYRTSYPVVYAFTYVQDVDSSGIPGLPTVPAGAPDPTADANYATAWANGKYIPISTDGSTVTGLIYRGNDNNVYYASSSGSRQSLGRAAVWLETTVDLYYLESSRTLTIKARRKFFLAPTRVKATVPPLNCYDYNLGGLAPGESGYSIEWKIGLNANSGFAGATRPTYPIRSHEWYHVGIRWDQYVQLNENPELVFTGFFHDDDGNEIYRGKIEVPPAQVVTQTLSDDWPNEIQQSTSAPQGNFQNFYNAQKDLQSGSNTYYFPPMDTDGDGTNDITPSVPITYDTYFKIAPVGPPANPNPPGGGTGTFTTSVQPDGTNPTFTANADYSVPQYERNWSSYFLSSNGFVYTKSPYLYCYATSLITIDDLAVLGDKNGCIEKNGFLPSRYPYLESPPYVGIFPGRMSLPSNVYADLPYSTFIITRTWPNGTQYMPPTGNVYYDVGDPKPASIKEGDWKKIYEKANGKKYHGNITGDLDNPASWRTGGPPNILIGSGTKYLWQLLLDYYQGKEKQFKFKQPPKVGTPAPSIVELEFNEEDVIYDVGTRTLDYTIRFIPAFRIGVPGGQEPLFRTPIFDELYMVYPLRDYECSSYLRMIR